MLIIVSALMLLDGRSVKVLPQQFPKVYCWGPALPGVIPEKVGRLNKKPSETSINLCGL